MELDQEERDAERALREAQLQATRVWLRQVEEENEDKLRERLAEQRKMQQEHFKKLVSKKKERSDKPKLPLLSLHIDKQDVSTFFVFSISSPFE